MSIFHNPKKHDDKTAKTAVYEGLAHIALLLKHINHSLCVLCSLCSPTNPRSLIRLSRVGDLFISNASRHFSPRLSRLADKDSANTFVRVGGKISNN